MMPDALQICPACGVKIELIPDPHPDRVLFAYGKPGTRADLAAKVCQYAKQPGCINRQSIDPKAIPQ